MKKLALAIAALSAMAVAVPTAASAQGFSVRIGDDGYRERSDYREFRGARAEYRGDRGWHRGWDRDRRRGERVTIIKRQRHWDD